MIDIESVSSYSEVVLTLGVSGMDPVPGQYVRYDFLPQNIQVRYIRVFRNDAYVWRCVNAALSGPRVLAPGKDGERRLGSSIHKQEWYSFGVEDVAGQVEVFSDNTPLPDDLRKLINELRPSGELTMPGE